MSKPADLRVIRSGGQRMDVYRIIIEVLNKVSGHWREEVEWDMLLLLIVLHKQFNNANNLGS